MEDQPINETNKLSILYGGFTDEGRRSENQDALVFHQPESYEEVSNKGCVACIADGVSCSEMSQQASQTSVIQFVNDYFATPSSWSVKRSATKVLSTTNYWLYGQGVKQPLKHNGLVTTFSSVVIKSNTAHIFHVGDSRIYLYRDDKLTLLTRDHVRGGAGSQTFLTRALGMDNTVNIDYQTLPIKEGDWFLLTTDGVHDFTSHEEIQAQCFELVDNQNLNPELAAKQLANLALDNGSTDNTSALFVGVNELPESSRAELQTQLGQFAIPPALRVGQTLDGFQVMNVLYAGSRSYVYEVTELLSGRVMVLKSPSPNMADDMSYLGSFIHEYWVGRQLDHPQFMKVHPRPSNAKFLYLLCEPLTGITLRQWMYDNPKPTLDQVRTIIRSLVAASRKLQRMGMVHRDLKPENIMVECDEKITVLDYGAMSVAAFEEQQAMDKEADLSVIEEEIPMGDAKYIAPEYLNGEKATYVSDLFSIGVICYEMLTGELPYKLGTTQSLRRARHQKWDYYSACLRRSDLPEWVDPVLKKVCAAVPTQRYQAMSEFITDLSTPNPDLILENERRSLFERNPVLFWKGLACIFMTLSIAELFILIS